MTRMDTRPLLAIVGVLGAAVLCGCPKPRAEAPTTAAPQVVLYGARVHTYQGNQTVMSGKAAKLAYQRGGGAFYASEVFLRFPRKSEPAKADGRPVKRKAFGADAEWVEVRAPWMTGGTSDKSVEATDGVALRTSAGMLATAQRGMFDGKSNTAQGRGAVDIEGPGYTASGRAFFLDLDEDVLELENEVETQLEGSR
jgi:lipopolysaccharide export system protein LptC